MAARYDLLVVGGGSAGITAASFAARLSLRVALIERDRLGGDCTWAGCVPSKTLLHFAKDGHRARAEFSWVMNQVRAVIGRVYERESAAMLGAGGVTVVSGAARFLDPWTLAVAGRRLQGRRIIICTGAAPIIPSIPGLKSAPYVTYESVWRLSELPRRLIVLGGGPTGVEFAQAFARLGSGVTIVEREPHLLPSADPEAGAVLERVLRQEGIELRTGRPATGMRTCVDGVRVALPDGEVLGDLVLVAAARRPRVEGLDLEQAGIAFSARGIGVDKYLRSNQRHIYAAGDVTGSFQFTHYAAWQGFTAARNALLPGSSRGVRVTVPWTVFTNPAIGQAGLTEREARRAHARVRVHRWPLAWIDRAQTSDELEGFVKIVARQDGRLLGATVVASAAGELINELALAIERGLTLSDLAATIHVYPTYSLGIQQVAAEATMAGLTAGWKGMALRTIARWWP